MFRYLKVDIIYYYVDKIIFHVIWLLKILISNEELSEINPVPVFVVKLS